MTKQDAINLFGSQSAVAKALGITRMAVSLWPDGELKPRDILALRMAWQDRQIEEQRRQVEDAAA